MITWIRGGRLVDPLKGTVQGRDVVIEGGKISALLPEGVFDPQGAEVRTIEAAGQLIVPGLVDMHVHLREPGQEYKETVASGTLAAVAGGFTGVACMPNTLPRNDTRAVTEFILEQAGRAGYAHVYPVAAITMGLKGERLSEFGDLRRAGAVALSDDGEAVMNSEVMRRALEYARFHGLPVISHCEDTNLSRGGLVHEGSVAARLGLAGIPAASEEIMVFRDIVLAQLTGCPVHIAHVSTAGSVELIRGAKARGVPVTAETAPHYFSLDHGAVEGYDTRAKVKPPLRTPADVEAVREGLKTDVIDAIATDHAPHSDLEKNVEFENAAFGMIGLETAVPLTLEMVRLGFLTLPQAVFKLSTRPAAILGVEGGHLAEGAVADLAIIDPEEEFVLETEDIVSKSKNSPFLGHRLKGRNRVTLVAGQIVWPRPSV